MITYFTQLPLPELEQEHGDYVDNVLAPFFREKSTVLMEEHGVTFHCWLVTTTHDGYKVDLYVGDSIYTIKIKSP